MSLEQCTKLRNGKIIDSSPEENTSTNLVKAESNTNDSDTNDISDISSPLTEMKKNYEKKITELHSEFSQLKDLMMAVNKKNQVKIVRRQVPKVFQSNPKGASTSLKISSARSRRAMAVAPMFCFLYQVSCIFVIDQVPCIILLWGEDTHSWSATKMRNPIQATIPLLALEVTGHLAQCHLA